MATKGTATTPKGTPPRSKRPGLAAAAAPSAESLELMRRASMRVKERSTAVRHDFIGLSADPSDSSAHPPLALLIRASKGAAVQLKFYLAVLWQAGGGDERHSATWPARTWAALLDLPDPEHHGDRRIRDAIKALERARLLTAVREPGRPIQIVLRRDDGSDQVYTHPGEAASAAKAQGCFDRSELYVQLPPTLWTNGWAAIMTAPGLAMLLVMLLLTRNASEQGIWINPSQARARFGLSADTWTRGVAELRHYDLLAISKRPVSEDFGWRRVRNTYTLRLDRLDETPTDGASPTPSAGSQTS
jgi:hypothetical protein